MADHIQITVRIEADTNIVAHQRDDHRWVQIGDALAIFGSDEQLGRLRDVIDAHLAGGS